MRKSLAAALRSMLAIFCFIAPASAADVFSLSNTDLTILNPDSLEVMGHAHYKVTRRDGAMLFEGEDRFLSGEYDHEVQRVELGANGAPPALVSYQHWFFNPDGSPESLDALDAKTGTLACTHYNGSDPPDVRESKAPIPPDTYVGSTQLMLLVGRLREGADSIGMHTFICLPGPHIVAMKVTSPENNVRWARYPGRLVKVAMVPDFGWLGLLAGPVIPKAYGWFDPAADFQYVGGLFDRFYRHRDLLMVRSPEAAAAPNPSTTNASR